MKITKEMRIGLISMMAIARSGEETLTATTIAREQELTKPFVEKIFSKLRRAGIVTAIKGPGGGYKLSREASLISVKDIFDVLSTQNKTEVQESVTVEQKLVDNLLVCYQNIASDFLYSTSLDSLVNSNFLKAPLLKVAS